MKLEYNAGDESFKKPFGAVAEDTAIAFCVALVQDPTEEPVSQVFLRLWPDEMDADRQDHGVTELSGHPEAGGTRFTFTWTAGEPGLYFYCFGAGSFPDEGGTTDIYQLTVYEKTYQVPSWLSGGLMYQIFPDRFARSSHYTGPPQNKNLRLHGKWGEEPCGPDENGTVWNNDFFGGNLAGIQQQLPYLAELGVTVIYLNPIFQAFSNHRYDTADYQSIDPMLGTEGDFRALCRQAEELGMRILLDGVFNHTGSHSLYFNKDGAFQTIGAHQSVDSPWYSWYTFSQYPDQYDCWWGIDTLPAVNELEESYRNFISRGEDSVIKHWLRCGASGIRLDVADELPDVFLEEVRQAVKEVKPDGAVIGEVWEDASNKIAYGLRRHYFQGRQLDSVMNYPLKDGILEFLNSHQDGSRLQELIMTLREHYPPMCFHSLMNVLGTHDTERIFTVFLRSCGSETKACQRLFLALLIWAFLPGIPCIYYGDELGMEGGRDPENRRCFQRQKAKVAVERFYRRLLSFRKTIPELAQMKYVPGASGKAYFSFQRMGCGTRLFVWLNTGSDTCDLQVPLEPGEKLSDFMNCGSISFKEPFGTTVDLELSGESGIALLIKAAKENEVQ